MDYAVIVWDPYTKTNIDKLEMVQRRAARFALNRYHNTSSASDVLQQLVWASLQERRMVLRLCMFYKIQKGVVYLGTQEPLLTVTTTRSSTHLHCSSYKAPFSRTSYHQMFFTIGINYQILLYWPQV